MIPPEIQLARRIVERRSLAPPIDVKALVEERASLKFKKIPLDVDGIVADLKVPGKRPRVFVNSARTPRRQRFTLAHEYGHIRIPWHMGTIVDVANEEDDSDLSQEYWRMEREANNFASELLLPTAWLRDLCYQDRAAARILEDAAKIADVSIAATAIGLLRAAPPGWLYAKVVDGVVVGTNKSSGTIHQNVPWGSLLSDIEFNAIRRSECIDFNSLHVWWEVDESQVAPQRYTARPWKDLQREVLAAVGLDSESERKLAQRINGILSSQNSQLLIRGDRSIDRLFLAFQIRLSEVDGDLSGPISIMRSHPLFLEYLRARADAFLNR